MRGASIDLGTNTCLLLVAEVGDEGARAISDHSTIVRLGQGVDQARELQREAMERTLTCLRGYRAILDRAGVAPGDVVCIATAQARDARNGPDFFSRIESELGLKFRVISGDEEARMTFVGALLPGFAAERSAVIDIGGGSTELMAKRAGEFEGQSLMMGSVRFTERHLRSDPVRDAEFWACQAAADALLEPLRNWRARLPAGTRLLGVAGTVTTLAQWHLALEKFDAAKIDGAELTRGDVHRMVEELKWRTVAERKTLTGVDPKRADVLLGGALILWRALEVLNFGSVFVSTRGLRYGALSSLQNLGR